MRLSEHPATTGMIATIHTLKAKARLDDETYRALLERETGHRSSKELTALQASQFIEKLREVAGEGPLAGGAVAGLDTPIGGKLRALWIAGYHLGVINVRNDRAMLVFLERQTGVSHVRFLGEPDQASKAIEGLKAWLARQADVRWPAKEADGADNVIANKRAVLDAQWRLLIAIGAVKAVGQAVDPMEDLQHYAGKIVHQNRWDTMKPHDYDEVQRALGNKLRGALQRRGHH